MRRSVALLSVGVACVLGASSAASASQATPAGSATPTVITPPAISGVASQSFDYGFGAISSFNSLPPKPGIVSVTLTLSEVSPSGAYVLCSGSNSVAPGGGGAYLPLSQGPFQVSGLMPDTKYWCFATSSPVGTLEPSAWSQPFEMTTRSALGTTTLAMLPEVYAAFATEGNYGPICTWCRDSASTSWRWPMAKPWRKGVDTGLPGGLHLPLPIMFNVGLDARLGVASDGNPTIAVNSALGWVDVVTTKDLQLNETGFTAKAFLTTSQLLLAYLPLLKLSPGQELGTLNLTQEFVPSAPAVPANLVAKAKRNPKGGASVTVSWQPPLEDGGSPVTGYRYQTRVGKTTSTWTATSALNFKLAVKSGATVRVSVVAVNEAGQSPVASITTRT